MKVQELQDRRRVLSDEPIEGELFSKIVETWFRDESERLFTVCTAVHRQDFDRRIGGVRFLKEAYPASLRELGDLAHAMTWKAALCGLPADGEKTVVYCHGQIPESVGEKAEVIAAHLRVLKEVDPGVVFGPDIGCDERVMDSLAHDHGLGDHVSGLTEGNGGFSIDEHGFTACGLEVAMTAAANLLSWDLGRMTMAVQGFGAVGAHAARLLSEHGVKVVAASTRHGALFAGGGLPVETLFAAWKQGGEEGFRRILESPPPGVETLTSKDALFEVKADIFVPAARTDVLKMPAELNDGLSQASMDAKVFRKTSEVVVVLEGANHPLSDRAEEYLMTEGVYVLPDYLVNCGGLIGCWMDWCHREELVGAEQKTRQDLVEKALSYIRKTVFNNVGKIISDAGGGSDGFRRLTDLLARSEREKIQEDFVTRRHGVKDRDGRALALAHLDSRLQQALRSDGSSKAKTGTN